ncbi:MAG: ROK family protein, partial [Limisphaerales bacterium]
LTKKLSRIFNKPFFIDNDANLGIYGEYSFNKPENIKNIYGLFIGTGIGGIVAPWLFGILTDSGSREAIMWGYVFAGALMILAAGVEAKLGLDCERQGLEAIATPLGALRASKRDPSIQRHESVTL